jgi:hypothetical protein
MKRRGTFLSLMLAFTFLFGAAFLCGQSNGGRGYTGQDETQPPAGGVRSSRSSGDLSDLPGTHWLLTYWGAKANPKYFETHPDVQFCKDGTWAVERYAGGSSYQEQGGSYQLSVDRLNLNDESGAFTGDYRLLSRSGDDLAFESSDGYVMGLRYVDSDDCSR